MKKIKCFSLVLVVAACMFCSSCATVFGGSITECQRTRPGMNQPSRAIRPVALIADIFLFWPGLIIDFADCAIYQPCMGSYNSSQPHYQNGRN